MRIHRPLTPLCLLFLGWMVLGLASPGSASAITGISRQTLPDREVVRVDLDAAIEPVVRYSSQEDCWQIDLVGVDRASTAPIDTPFAGPVLALRCGQVNADPPIQRISMHLVPGARMKLVRRPGGFQVELKPTDRVGDLPRGDPGRPAPQPLISPAGEQGEVIVEVRHAQALPIIAQLVEGAGFDLRFRDPLPKVVTLNVRRPNALEALRAVAGQMGMVLTREADGWWLTRRDNPLLGIPAEGCPVGPDAGTTVSEVLRRLAGEPFLDRLGRSLSKTMGDRAFAVPAGSSNPRTVVQNLLDSQGIHLAAQ